MTSDNFYEDQIKKKYYPLPETQKDGAGEALGCTWAELVT